MYKLINCCNFLDLFFLKSKSGGDTKESLGNASTSNANHKTEKGFSVEASHNPTTVPDASQPLQQPYKLRDSIKSDQLEENVAPSGTMNESVIVTANEILTTRKTCFQTELIQPINTNKKDIAIEMDVRKEDGEKSRFIKER